MNMVKIQGDGGELPKISAQDKKMYLQEYHHAADLFERAVDAYGKSDNPYQKKAYEKVMNQALQILNETAQGMSSPELLKQNEIIQKDFEAFNAGTQDASKQLISHLEEAKKAIE